QRDISKAIRERLAQALLRKQQQAHAARANPETDEPERIYIRRPNLETELTAALSAGQSPIVLWGETGNGKSQLARQIASDLYGDRVAILRGPAVVDSLYEQDLIRLLASNGYDRTALTMSMSAMELALKDLLRSGANFDVIVIDNIDEGAMERLVE